MPLQITCPTKRQQVVRITFCSSSWTGFNDNSILDRKFYNLNWMKDIPENTPVSAIAIPGTHESLSLHGGPLVKCQIWTLEDQLNVGIRYFDVHAGIWLPNQKHIYVQDRHWMFWQHIRLDEVLPIILDFLKDTSRIKSPKMFAKKVNKQLYNFVVQHKNSSLNQGCLGVLSMNFPSADLIQNIIQLKTCSCGISNI
ncbi:1-phosphatidylinositol phosphodiesterase-like [Anoplopoma fimbria]|uniref:1-phosphatidylinositol phosphodiesterase-like n=1 Tax=Anoplopoma fimbria TaxID=229290 RepID=UPI0023ECB7B7|nr:1-phosphatidylinositol phosphodiesterase-like [Anoplopoma fimbria]